MRVLFLASWYPAHAAMALLIAGRLSGEAMLSPFVPDRAEVGLLVAGLQRLTVRVGSRESATSGSGGSV